MEPDLLLVKIIAAIHGMAGGFGIVAVLRMGARETGHFGNRWLALTKIGLTYAMCVALLACGISPWFQPTLTPLLAWVALLLHVLSVIIDTATANDGESYCWRCTATGFGIKLIAACALSFLVYTAANA